VTSIRSSNLLTTWLHKALENKRKKFKKIEFSSSTAQSEKSIFKRYPLVKAKIQVCHNGRQYNAAFLEKPKEL